MKQSKKVKWIVGLSGVAFSSFVLGQFETNNEESMMLGVAQSAQEAISEEEKELLALDWENFVFIESTSATKKGTSDRTTKRS